MPEWLSMHGGGGGGGLTFTTAEQDAVPPGPVAVPVYVVVAVGETTRVPLGTGVTEPMPWLIEKETAFVVVHVSVELLPSTMVTGFEERVQVGAEGGGGGTFTLTIAVHDAVPPGPVAVPVYVVVAVGDTEREPLATGVTPPMP